MDSTILLLLTRDGLTTGLIYALLGIAALVVFSVTRVLFVPQGEFVAFSALSVVAFQDGRMPGLANMLIAFAAVCAIVRLIRERRGRTLQGTLSMLAFELLPPVAIWCICYLIAPMKPGYWVTVPLIIAMSVSISTALYRTAFEAIAKASVLVLLIAAFGAHMVMIAMGLHFFGPEGFMSAPFSDASISLGSLNISWQEGAVLVVTLLLMLGLWAYFGRSLSGMALRASAVNRVGAQLVGIAPRRTGQFAFGLAAAIGAVSGVLIGPMTTIYHDTGFMIGLKGVLAAVLGGLASYPLTVGAALFLAVLESFTSFWASAYKEVVVFLTVVPVLLWRSLVNPHMSEEEH